MSRHFNFPEVNSKKYMLEPDLKKYVLVPEVGNWPKKSNALALAIVSLKCNALVIMH